MATCIWPQCTMVYDGTFTGFLSCAAEAFRTREYPYYIVPHHADLISLYPIREVTTDPHQAKALYRALETEVSHNFQRMIAYAFLTDLPHKERHIWDVIWQGLSGHLPQDMTDDRVLLLDRAIRRLVNEAHHYKGFVRFSDYSGVLVGQIAPKNRVLPLLRPHFCQRLPNETFLLHDMTHGEALLFADGKWKIRPVASLDLDKPDAVEEKCRALWRRFFETVAIPERRNPKCQDTHLPKRFREQMTEFQPTGTDCHSVRAPRPGRVPRPSGAFAF